MFTRVVQCAKLALENWRGRIAIEYYKPRSENRGKVRSKQRCEDIGDFVVKFSALRILLDNITQSNFFSDNQKRLPFLIQVRAAGSKIFKFRKFSMKQ